MPETRAGQNKSANAAKISKIKKDEAEFLKSFEQKKKNFAHVQSQYNGGANTKFKAEFDKLKREVENGEKEKLEYEKKLREFNESVDRTDDVGVPPASKVKLEESDGALPPVGKTNPKVVGYGEIPLGNGKADGEKRGDEKADSEKPDGEKPDGEKTDGEKPDDEKSDGEKPDDEKSDGEKSDDEKSDDGTDDGGEGGPLFTLNDLREALGQEDRGKVIAWKSGGGARRVVISRYGPRNARRYRLQRAGDADDAWSEESLPMITDTDLRFGAQKTNRGKYIHGGSEVIGITAVAWYFDDSNQAPEALLSLKTHPKLEPLTKEQQKNKEKRQPRPALYPETQVLVRWNINDKVEESWETRETVARLYKSAETSDQFIYLVAVEQEKRYKQWKNKQRKSESRSPTPMPGLFRPQSTPDPEDKKRDGKPGDAAGEDEKEKAARKKWATKKNLDPEHLSDTDDARFDAYWQVFQAATVAAAA